MKIPLIEDLYTSSGILGEPWSLVDVHANNTIWVPLNGLMIGGLGTLYFSVESLYLDLSCADSNRYKLTSFNRSNYRQASPTFFKSKNVDLQLCNMTNTFFNNQNADSPDNSLYFGSTTLEILLTSTELSDPLNLIYK